AGLNTKRLAACGKARDNGWINANIWQSAAAKFWNISHIVWVAVEVGKRTLNMFQFANRTALQKLAHFQPERRIGDHIGLGNHDAGSVADRDKAIEFLSFQCHWFFAKHMLTSFRGFFAPLDML